MKVNNTKKRGNHFFCTFVLDNRPVSYVVKVQEHEIIFFSHLNFNNNSYYEYTIHFLYYYFPISVLWYLT